MPPRLPLTAVTSPVLRPLLPAPRRVFSTTPGLLARAVKIAPKAKSAQGGTKQNFVKKKNTKDESRKGAYNIGERRQIRNRIVLSNTNAQPLEDIPALSPELIRDDEAAGKVFAFPEEEVDKLRTLKGFFRTQDWKLFARPCSVLRRQTMDIGASMDAKEPEMRRIVLDGYKGSGKSVMLLQLMTWAFQKGWLVMNISNAQELVIGHTDYEFDADTGKWTHSTYTSQMIQRIVKANDDVLSKLFLTTNVKLGRHEFISGTPLMTVLTSAGRDYTSSTDTFRFLLSELSVNPEAPRVLFAIENFNLLQLPTAYRNPDFKIIHAHEFALPSMFNEFLRGEKAFKNGGLVMGVTSRTIAPRAEEFESFLRGEELGPYSKGDRRVHAGLKGAEVMEMSGMDGEEATSLLEYCRDSGLLKVEEIEEELVTERLLLSSGLPKEIVRSCVRVAR